MDAGEIDLGIPVSPKKWTENDLKYLFGPVAIREYIERMNALVLPEIAKKHIVFKHIDGWPRIIFKKKSTEKKDEFIEKELFRLEVLFTETPSFFIKDEPYYQIKISSLPIYSDKIHFRWWVLKKTSLQGERTRRGETHELHFTVSNDPTMNETRLAHILFMLCIYNGLAYLPNVDLTSHGAFTQLLNQSKKGYFYGRLDEEIVLNVILQTSRFNYLDRTGKVSQDFMREIDRALMKFKAFVQATLPPPKHEEELTEYKNRIGEMLVKQIADAYGIETQQMGGRRKRKNVKKVSK